tara:strand:- start:293 stop:3592 length:3300 start_codon:yes stop_codon:yes gene_type:complete
MVKYLSGRVKRTPQDQLKEDRFRYLNLEQAEPNLADPPTSNVPTGQQFQLIAIPGQPGKRYWVPTGGGLIPGAITIFDENVQVSAADSITQVNFEGKAVTADVSVQSPSGHPGFAATVTVIPVTVGDNPPNTPTPRNGELWWESDTGDLYVYYEDVNSSQWVQANAGGRGDDGDKGDKGEPSTVQGPQGIQGVEGEKGAPGNVLAKGVKGEPGTSIKGEPGASIKGEPGASIKGEPGNDIKGDKGDQGDQGDKAGILFKFANATSMVDPNPGNFRFNSTALSNVSAIAIDALDNNSNDFSDFLTTWDDSTNTVKGTLEIKSNLNTDTTHAVFQITSITDNVGWLQIGVQNPVGNIPSNLEVCVLNFSRAGDKGQKGEVNVAAAGANTQVQFNDNGSFAGANNLQFIKSNTTPELILKPSDTSTNTNGGSLTVQNANNSNHSQLTSDGALELKRTNETVTTGGPYIDFKNAGTDNDARIEMDIASGQQNNANYSSIAFKTGGSGSISEKFRIGKAGQIGLSGANYGNANQVLTSKGANSPVEWTTQLNDDTTYDLIVGSSGNDVTLTLDASVGDDDAIQIGAGTNVSFAGVTATGFTINTLNTQLSTEEVEDIVGAMFSSNTETRISATYDDNGSGNGKINLVVDDMTADNNTIYDLGTADGDNTSEEKIQLTGNDSTTDTVILAVGSGLSIQRDNASNKITFTNTDTGSGSNNTFIGLTDTPSSFTASKFVVVNAAGNALEFVDNPNTQLTTEQVQDIVGAMFSNNTETRISATYQDSDGTIDLIVDDQSANDNTTYDLSVPNSTTKIRLAGSDSTNDDVEIAGGTGISVTRNNGNKLTITNTDTGSGANTDTTYDLSVPNSTTKIRLAGSDSTNDDVEIAGGTGISVTRNNGNKLTIANTDTGSGANENFYLTALSFNTSNGVLTATVNGATNPTVDLDGRYVSQSTGGSSGIPSGGIIIWSGAANAIPSGWYLCDGSNNTPDLRGRFVVGYHNGDGDYDVNDTGGAKNVTLQSSEMPSHFHYSFRSGNHGQLQNGSNLSANNYPGSGSGRANLYEGYNINSSGSVANVGKTSNTPSGSTSAHENRPPYYALCYIMKS